MKLKSNKGSISIFVIVALTFYMSFSMLMYAANLNKIQTITEKMDAVKAIYSRNYDNIDDVYNRKLAKENKMKPIINLPNKIITNVTKLGQYVEYGGTEEEKTEYSAFGETKTSMDELIKYIDDNKKYGMVSITVNAYGANGQISNETKEIEIIRGMKVANESELNTAFSTTGDLYVYVANNIECTNVISADNINHKLDLNNNQILYKVYNQSFDFITIGSNAKLTVLDSSSQKNGKILASMSLNDGELETSDGKNRNNTVVCIKNNGELNIESGTIGVIARQLLDSTYGTSVTDISTAIYNSGTVNLKGGNITAETITQACVNLLTKNSNATANGIINEGILNLEEGTIDIKSESKIIRGEHATRKGNTYAYSYGVVNTGTLNNSNNVQITVNSTASTDNANVKANEAIEIK